MEDRLEQLGVPFVALRPGAFLDQVTRFGGDPIAGGQVHVDGLTARPPAAKDAIRRLIGILGHSVRG